MKVFLEIHTNNIILTCDEIVAIFRKGNCFDFGRDLVGSYFDVVVPVPNIDNHILLRTDYKGK